METQEQFIERRKLAHAAGCADLDRDILVQAAFDRTPAPPLSEAIKRCLYKPGFMFKRQAD